MFRVQCNLHSKHFFNYSPLFRRVAGWCHCSRFYLLFSVHGYYIWMVRDESAAYPVIPSCDVLQRSSSCFAGGLVDFGFLKHFVVHLQYLRVPEPINAIWHSSNFTNSRILVTLLSIKERYEKTVLRCGDWSKHTCSWGSNMCLHFCFFGSEV